MQTHKATLLLVALVLATVAPFAKAVNAAAGQAQVFPPPSEDKARLRWCEENPNASDCVMPTGGLPQPPCWPANFSGAGTIIYSGSTDAGSWHYWYCQVNGEWQGVGVVLPLGGLLIHPREPRSSPAATAAAYWALNAFAPTTPGELATEKAMRESMARYIQWAEVPWSPPAPRAPPVAPATAVVAKNASYPTRPAYTTQPDGTVGTKEAGRAAVGATCDCQRVRIVKGESIYCGAPPPVTGLVTLCKIP